MFISSKLFPKAVYTLNIHTDSQGLTPSVWLLWQLPETPDEAYIDNQVSLNLVSVSMIRKIHQISKMPYGLNFRSNEHLWTTWPWSMPSNPVAGSQTHDLLTTNPVAYNYYATELCMSSTVDATYTAYWSGQWWGPWCLLAMTRLLYADVWPSINLTIIITVSEAW